MARSVSATFMATKQLLRRSFACAADESAQECLRLHIIPKCCLGDQNMSLLSCDVGSRGLSIQDDKPIDCPESLCGNAFRDPGEECDDGNRDSGDGCLAQPC